MVVNEHLGLELHHGCELGKTIVELENSILAKGVKDALGRNLVVFYNPANRNPINTLKKWTVPFH